MGILFSLFAMAMIQIILIWRVHCVENSLELLARRILDEQSMRIRLSMRLQQLEDLENDKIELGTGPR